MAPDKVNNPGRISAGNIGRQDEIFCLFADE